MACSGAYATPAEFKAQWFWSFDSADDPELQPILDNSASRIHAALASQGMCDCSLAPWADAFLKELNLMIAAVDTNIACVRLSDEQRRIIFEAVNANIDRIVSGEFELCAGETGKNYPAFAIAQYALTDQIATEIIVNEALKDSS